MHILLTNDDGIKAPGLVALYKQLSKLGEVSVVAPAEGKSAASHSITLSSLAIEEFEVDGVFKGLGVFGSPADCVKLSVNELINKPIDLIVSGMNYGANVGINVCYSGTVGAAMEGAFYDIPSVAISTSIDNNIDFDKCAELGITVLKQLLPVRPGGITNINLPRLSLGSPKGLKVVPQSRLGYEEKYEKEYHKDRVLYTIVGGRHKHEPVTTDTIALHDQYVTITPLHFDLTDHSRKNELDNKFKGFTL